MQQLIEMYKIEQQKCHFYLQYFDTRYRLLFVRAIASPFIIQNVYLLNQKAQNETSTLTFIVSNCFLMAGFINNSTFTIAISKRNRFHKTVFSYASQ